VAVTDQLAAFAILLGIIFSFSNKIKKSAFIFSILGILGGFLLFVLRVYDPKGMNIFLIALNRKLAVTIAAIALLTFILTLIAWLTKNKILRFVNIFSLEILVIAVFSYLLPPVLQYTREFVYFGEAGISTNAILRALGFTLGIIIFLLLILSSYEVHKSLRNDNEKYCFLSASILIFVFEYGAAAITALQRLKILKTSQAIFNISVFDVMIWRGANPNAFLYAQLILALLMLVFVIKTHLKPIGEFANRALLRKEKARLRDSRRWSWSLCIFGLITIFIVVGVSQIIDRELLSHIDLFKGTEMIRDMVICFYLANEGLSILENAIKIGIPIPNVIKERLAAFKNSSEGEKQKTA